MPGFATLTLYVSVKSEAFPEKPLKDRESGGMRDAGSRTLFDVMMVAHCLHMRARGILGRGLEARRSLLGEDCTDRRPAPGTDGRRRTGDGRSGMRVEDEPAKSCRW